MAAGNFEGFGFGNFGKNAEGVFGKILVVSSATQETCSYAYLVTISQQLVFHRDKSVTSALHVLSVL